jgi:hypothetical protein
MDVLLKRGMKEGFLVLFFIIVISNLFYLINGGGIGGVISYSLLMPFGIILSFLMPEICFFFGIGFGLIYGGWVVKGKKIKFVGEGMYLGGIVIVSFFWEKWFWGLMSA